MIPNERIPTSVLLIVLAGCASAPSTRLDNEAFGGNPYVPASGAVCPDPSPSSFVPEPAVEPAAVAPAKDAHATDAPTGTSAPDPTLDPLSPPPPYEGTVDRHREPWEFVLFGSGAS